MRNKKKSPCTAATVAEARPINHHQNNTIHPTCKARLHGRIYTKAEIDAELNELVSQGEEIFPLSRSIFIELGKLGLLDAFCEVVLDMPSDDYESDPVGYIEFAIAEAYRRVSA